MVHRLQLQLCSRVNASLGKRAINDVVYKKTPHYLVVQFRFGQVSMVSNEERKRMACAPRDILIEQVQTMPPQNVVQRYYKNNTMTEIQRFSIDLGFSCYKSVIFGLKNVTNSSVHSNYTTEYQ